MDRSEFEKLLSLLNHYTLAAEAVLETTELANERTGAKNHLGRCAVMYALLLSTNKASSISDIVSDEIRNHGWSFYSGDEGKELANSWAAFKSYFESIDH